MPELNAVQEIMELREDVAGMRTDIKAAFKRLDEQARLVETVHTLALGVQEMASEQKHLREEQQRLRLDVDALRMQPGKRWEALVGQVVTALVAVAVGFFLGAK